MQPWKVFIKKWKMRGRVHLVTSDSLKKNVDLSKKYLSLSHLFSNNLKRPPKSKNWFCNICRIKSRNQDQSQVTQALFSIFLLPFPLSSDSIIMYMRKEEFTLVWLKRPLKKDTAIMFEILNMKYIITRLNFLNMCGI